MKTLRVCVTNKVAVYNQRDGDIVCGNSDYEIEFTFDSEWNAYDAKIARFIWNGEYFDVDFTGNTCSVPVIQNTDVVTVGVYAGDLRTTTPATIGCKRSILCGGEEPNPGTGQHYTAEAVVAAENAKTSETNAKTSEDNARASETNAKTSETNAKTSETNAKTSEANAASSATQARGYMEAAQTIAADSVNMDARITRNSKRITNLERGLTPDPFFSDDSVAYQKIVPENALPYAEVSKIGGMSHKTKNYIVYPYAFTTATKNGVTFTANSDGSIKISGTATANAQQHVKRLPKIPKGTYCLSGATNSISVYMQFWNGTTWVKEIWVNGEITIDYSNYDAMDVVVYVPNGISVNTTIYPMLNAGSTALPYEQYFSGLRDTKVMGIKSVGANLISYPYLFGGHITQNGITVTAGDDGSLTINGTTTGYCWIVCSSINTEVGEQYTARAYDCPGTMAFYMFHSDSDTTFFRDSATTITARQRYYNIVLATDAGYTYNNVKVYPMINAGASIMSFAPYKENTLAIPASVQALDGYGLGVDAKFCNHVLWGEDGDTRTYHNKVKKIVFDGTENWSASATESGNYRFRLVQNPAPLFYDIGYATPMICSHYNVVTAINTWQDVDGVSIHGNEIMVKDSNYDTNVAWKAYLAEQYAAGTPVTLVYALANPTVTDISDLITSDNMLEVEGGGIIVAENENRQGASTTITYQLREVSE